MDSRGEAKLFIIGKYISNDMYYVYKEESCFLNAITTYGGNDIDNIQSSVKTRSKNQIRNRLQKVTLYTVV